jgi:zinc transporter
MIDPVDTAFGSDQHGLVSRPPAWMAEVDVQNLRESARILFLLTVVTVLALPFNVIGGPFGMNVGGIPFAAHRHGFLIVISVAVALTLLGGVMVMRRRRDW